MISRKFKYTIYLVLLLSALSCSREEVISSGGNDKARIHFKVNFPSSDHPVPTATKGGLVDNQNLYENKIDRMTVLVFRRGRLVQAMDGENIHSSEVSTDFTINTRSGSDPVKFYLLGNTSQTLEELTSLLYNKTPEEVKQSITALSVNVNNHGISSGFPFWGEIDCPGGLSSSHTSITGIKMLRATARAIVRKKVDDSVLKITSAAIYRMKDKISVIPLAVNSDMDVTSPTVPSTAGLLAPVTCDASTLPLGYYLAESEASATLDASVKDATCIIIGGRFGGSITDTYYRIDFEDRTSGVLKVGQILRNHSYSFEIESVSSPGWPTAEEAANNMPTGLKVEVKDWEEKASETIQNQEHNLTVSSREINLSGTKGSSSYIKLTTTAEEPSLLWVGGQNGTSRIENDDFIVELVRTGTEYRIVATAKKTNTKNIIAKDFLLKASNLTVKFRINQTVAVTFKAQHEFMWIPSDGIKKQPNKITSFHTWEIVAKDSWIQTSVSGDILEVWGDRNDEVLNESRMGRIELKNAADAHLYISVKQVRLIEWSNAYLRGGNCFKGDHLSPPYKFYSGGDGKTYYTYSQEPRPLTLSRELQEGVGMLKSWEVGKPKPENYDMHGDFYTYEQAEEGCSKLNIHLGQKWKLPSHDECIDHLLRAEKVPIIIDSQIYAYYYYIYNPDGKKIFMPNASEKDWAVRCKNFVIHVETPNPMIYNDKGLKTTYMYKNIGVEWGYNARLFPVRCVKKYD